MNSLKQLLTHRWIKNNKGTITISFNYLKVKYSFNPIAGGKFADAKDRAIANSIADQIEKDIQMGQFEGIDKYRPTGQVINIRSKQVQSKPQEITLQTIWDNYKEKNLETTAKTTQKTKWLSVDKMVELLSTIPLKKMTATNAVDKLLETYKTSTIRTALNYLKAAIELAVECKQLTGNPLAGFKSQLPRHINHRKKAGFSIDTLRKIVEAFKSDRYVSIYSNYLHSHYAEFVEFLFLTGLRPQMPCALRWSDIKTNKDGSRVILLDRAYTNGVLKGGKNNRAVLFPVYPQLAELLDRIPQRNPTLVFPSPTGGFINLNNFTTRYWGVVVKSLVKDGEISVYLPTYHCRHTAATMMASAGVPSAAIAALLDTSEEILEKHYLDDEGLTCSLSLNNLY